MPTDLENQIGAGFGAMAAGDWTGARAAFVGVLETGSAPSKRAPLPTAPCNKASWRCCPTPPAASTPPA